MELIPALQEKVNDRVVQPTAAGMNHLRTAASSVDEAQSAMHAAAGTDSEQLRQSAESLGQAQRAIGDAMLYLTTMSERLQSLARKWGIALDPQLLANIGGHSAASSGVEADSSPAEFRDEPTLFHDRVRTLEQEAAAGRFGKPMKFLSSTEIEFRVLQHGRAQEIIDTYPPGPVSNGGLTMMIPNTDRPFPTPEEQTARTEQLRDEAREYVNALTPASEEEAAQKTAWLANVETLTPTDLINFALYREFSAPTLGETAPPKGATFDEMNTYGEHAGWIEFRFGSGIFQQGYYDNPNSCEMRLTPCAPHELAERQAIIEQRAADLALEQGLMFIETGTHINLSVYTSEPDQNGEESVWKPVVGRDAERQAQTLDIVAGLSAAIEDGVWVHEEKAADRYTFGEASFTAVERPITQVRGAIRVLDDYVELRAKDLSASTNHALTWMMAGMTYGAEHGAETIAAEPGRAAPTIQPKLQPVRNENFDKTKDLQFQRMIEQGELLEAGGFGVDFGHLSGRGEQLAASLGLELKGDEATVFAELFMSSLDIEEDGQLTIQPAVFIHVYNKMLAPESQEKLVPAIQRIGFGNLYRAAEAAVNRDAIRLSIVPQITARPKPPGLEPDEWQQRWQRSEIMNRAYGNQTAAYAQHLRDVAAEHYVPIDLDDPASVEEARQELLRRRNR